MAKRVILQAGHSSAYPPGAANGGGAPGEASWTGGLASWIASYLRKVGVTVDIVGTWLVTLNGAQVTLAPPAAVTKDADLFLSIHYDAAVYGAGKNTGAFADHAAGEPVAAESLRFISLWERRYFKPYPQGTGLPNTTARRNVNTSLYYGYRATTSNTPSVLIEHGVGAKGAGDDAWLLWDHIGLIAALDAAAILDFLGLTPAPVPIPTPVPIEEDDVLPNDTPVLTDDELEKQYRALLWGPHYIDGTADFAIPARWKQLVREGRDPGTPMGPEMSVQGQDWVAQRFERLTITYRNGRTSVRA